MILKNKSVFIFGITKFDGAIESTSFTTAKFLAKNNDVYYIDFPYTLKDYFSDNKKAQFKKREKAFFSWKDCLLDTPYERLKILILPPLISTNFLPENNLYRLFLALNERIIINRLKLVIRNENIQDFIFVNSFNFHYPNVGVALNADLLVYHCVDPLVIDYDKRHGLISEEIISRKSDLIICTSKQLYREKIRVNTNTFFIPNAADLAHCSSALNDDLAVYVDLQPIKKPVIGYFGNIERRIDFDMLQKVVKNNPEKSFVFAGPVDEKYLPTGFKEMDNVFFLGTVPYKDMPAVLKGFDVSIIPFKKDDVSATIFPLKLFEYLGAGKPVVSTDFNSDLYDFTEDTVIYCQNHLEFTKAIDVSLQQDQPELKNKRLLVASANTWDERLREFSALIFSFYEKKKMKINA